MSEVNPEALKAWARKWRESHGEALPAKAAVNSAERRTIAALRAELTAAIKRSKMLKAALEEMQTQHDYDEAIKAMPGTVKVLDPNAPKI